MPPASAQTVKNYCSLLSRSNLMTSDEVKESHRRWQESAKGAAEDDVEPFRKFLVSKKLLTDYQSHLLLRGHADGFFLNQYKILELIGKGRMAGVFKSANPAGQVFAVKVLPSSKAKDTTILSRFLREGNLLTKLDHPNVVRAFELGETGGRHYIVMEYLEGETLDEILDRRKRLPPVEAVRLVHQSLLGLQHVFERGMVHRDLKPANLVLSPAPAAGPSETTLDSTLKILDIGLGRATFDETTKESDPDTLLTTEGTLLGTPDYLAPEQARSAHQADIRSDIYSVGCVLYHLLTGQTPFPDTNVLSQVVRHATETPRPLSDFLPQAPDGLQQVLNWMMAKDPNQRYPTPARAAQALQMFLGQPPQPAPATPAPNLPSYLQDLKAAEASRPAAAPPPGQAVPKTQPAAPKILVAKLETDGRKKDPLGLKPKLPATKIAVESSPLNDEYDVEIIGALPPQPPASSSANKRNEESRGLFEPDRRDFIMAGFGAGLVIVAILIGWGLSRLVKGSPATPSTPAEQPQDDQTPPKKKIIPEEKIADKKAVEKPKGE